MVYIQNTLCIINLIWSCILGNSQIGPYLFRDTSFKKQVTFNEHMVETNSIYFVQVHYGVTWYGITQNIVCVKELICSYILGKQSTIECKLPTLKKHKI